jgi:hypothetical protein|nr:MAG TPA: hypothetical protein [Caudoviricetes sp.]
MEVIQKLMEILEMAKIAREELDRRENQEINI